MATRPSDEWSDYFRTQWLPQLQEGGVDLQVLPVFIDDVYRPEGALRRTLRMIEAAHRLAEGNADAVGLCLDGDDIDRVIGEGRIALVLALEGMPGIADDVELLETVHRLGIRIGAVAHFGRSAFADGSGEDAAGSRLTRTGIRALAEMERVGMIFDISHLGASGVDHVLEIATRPVMATHSSARALFDHHRNLTDAQVIAGDREWRTTLNADNPDLSAFKARGGKLIGYHGWNDPAIPPGLSLEYLANVRKAMGSTDDFYRVFMVPGMLHCRGGDAPVNVDWFALLDSWVETGVAPATVTAAGGGATQVLNYQK